MDEMTASDAIRILTELAHHLTQVKRGGSSLDLGEIAAIIQDVGHVHLVNFDQALEDVVGVNLDLFHSIGLALQNKCLDLRFFQ